MARNKKANANKQNAPKQKETQSQETEVKVDLPESGTLETGKEVAPEPRKNTLPEGEKKSLAEVTEGATLANKPAGKVVTEAELEEQRLALVTETQQSAQLTEKKKVADNPIFKDLEALHLIPGKSEVLTKFVESLGERAAINKATINQRQIRLLRLMTYLFTQEGEQLRTLVRDMVRVFRNNHNGAFSRQRVCLFTDSIVLSAFELELYLALTSVFVYAAEHGMPAVGRAMDVNKIAHLITRSTNSEDAGKRFTSLFSE